MQVTVCRLVMGAARSVETSEEEAIDTVRFQYLWDAKAVYPIRPGTRMNNAILGEQPFILRIARMQIGFGETGALIQRRKREFIRGPG